MGRLLQGPLRDSPPAARAGIDKKKATSPYDNVPEIAQPARLRQPFPLYFPATFCQSDFITRTAVGA